MTARLLIVLLVLAQSVSCRTAASVDGGEGGIPQGLIHCGVKATADSARHVIDDANTALVSEKPDRSLTELAARFTLSAITCAVLYIVGVADHNFAASGDRLERERAEAGRAWLAKHPADMAAQ